MRAQPRPIFYLKTQLPVIGRPVRTLAYIIQHDLVSLLSGNPKSHRIPPAVDGEAWTTQRISQVAAVLQVNEFRSLAFVAGRGAVPAPAGSKREARGMQPGTSLGQLNRHKERTGHKRAPDEKFPPGSGI